MGLNRLCRRTEARYKVFKHTFSSKCWVTEQFGSIFIQIGQAIGEIFPFSKCQDLDIFTDIAGFQSINT